MRNSSAAVVPEKCGFAAVLNKAANKGFRNEKFEEQLSRLIQQRTAQRTAATVYTVPVVFHIVHRGEAVGTYPNLSAAQVAAQLDQLNKDFANLSQSAYGVAADAGLRFCAAVVDQAGRPLSEPGIHRINAAANGWLNTGTMTTQEEVMDYFDNVIKPATVWDAYSYVNVWTADISVSALLGYASFPELSTLDGLRAGETDATAGAVIEAASVGSKLLPSTGSPYNLGRTLTHELGHFFGLRHIWGDAACGNDYCADTPPQSRSTTGCPSSPAANGCTPAVPKMFENYMDYTNDACLNTFTADQVARMQTVMTNSPRRKELAGSKACEARPGNSVQFTLRQTEQTETGTTTGCPSTKTVTATVAVSVQAMGAATLTFTTGGTAATGADYTVSPSSVSFAAGDAAPKTITITVIDDKSIEPTETIELNYTVSGTGVQAGPDKQQLTVVLNDDDFERRIGTVSSVPLLNENFNSAAAAPAGWFVQNGSVNGWAVGPNGGAGTTGNAAYVSNDFAAKPNQYSKTDESEAFLVTPLLDATGLANVNLSFKWRCQGEPGYDEGVLGYILENDPNEIHFFNLVFNGLAGTAQTISGTLPATFNNSRFYLVFYWYNDDAIGADPGFTVDDVTVTAWATTVETTAGETAAVPLYSGQTAQYITADNQIVARLSGPNENLGCIAATVQNAGTGRTVVQTATGSYFRTNKVIRLMPGAANTTAAYQATFYFTAAELSAWTAGEIPNLKILKVKDGVSLSGVIGTADAQLISTAFADNSANGYYSFTGNFSGGFSQFMLVSPNFTLPVNLLLFEAQPQEKSIRLWWRTAAEKGNKGFQVERSVNGFDFTAVGWVASVGTTATESSYAFTDNFVQPNTLYYYRLKQVDLDDRAVLSNLRQAKIAGSAVVVTVSPNPAKGKLTVFFAGSTQPATVSMVNAKGQTVARWAKVNPALPTSFDVSRLAKGYYNLVVHLPGGDAVRQVIID